MPDGTTLCECCEKEVASVKCHVWTCLDCSNRHLFCVNCGVKQQAHGNFRASETFDGVAVPMLKLCPKTKFFKVAMRGIWEDLKREFEVDGWQPAGELGKEAEKKG